MASIPVTYTLAVLVFISVLFSCTGFSLKGFCASNCARGKGGNVCKCNGFHFAGKRGPSSDNAAVYSDSTPSDTKGENFLELDSNGFGVFGYPKDEARTISKYRPDKLRALLQTFLAERYARENGIGTSTGSQSWQEYNPRE